MKRCLVLAPVALMMLLLSACPSSTPPETEPSTSQPRVGTSAPPSATPPTRQTTTSLTTPTTDTTDTTDSPPATVRAVMSAVAQPNGTLTWDIVDGASSYTVILRSGDQVWVWLGDGTSVDVATVVAQRPALDPVDPPAPGAAIQWLVMATSMNGDTLGVSYLLESVA